MNTKDGYAKKSLTSARLLTADGGDTDNYLPLTGGTMTGALVTTALSVTGAATFSQAINGNILGNAATASRLQNARTISLTGPVTGSVSFDGSGNAAIATRSNYTNKVYGYYTSNGGKQPPSYFGTNRSGFLMSNATVNGDSHYKNWLYMDCYNGNDAGGATAFGIDRTEPRAFIMQSDSTRASWNTTAELITTYNIENILSTYRPNSYRCTIYTDSGATNDATAESSTVGDLSTWTVNSPSTSNSGTVYIQSNFSFTYFATLTFTISSPRNGICNKFTIGFRNSESQNVLSLVFSRTGNVLCQINNTQYSANFNSFGESDVFKIQLNYQKVRIIVNDQLLFTNSNISGNSIIPTSIKYVFGVFPISSTSNTIIKNIQFDQQCNHMLLDLMDVQHTPEVSVNSILMYRNGFWNFVSIGSWDPAINIQELDDNILEGSVSSTVGTYAPYTSRPDGAGLYSGNTDPNGTTRLNYNGYFYATKVFSGGVELSNTSALPFTWADDGGTNGVVCPSCTIRGKTIDISTSIWQEYPNELPGEIYYPPENMTYEALPVLMDASGRLFVPIPHGVKAVCENEDWAHNEVYQVVSS